MTKQIFSGTYLIDGTAFTQHLTVEIISITSLGTYQGRTKVNGKTFESKGTWNSRTFHNEWQGGSVDGIVSSEGDILGVIRIGIMTGSVTLTMQPRGED